MLSRLVLLFVIIFIRDVAAQDERLFRETLLGGFSKEKAIARVPSRYSFKANTDMYRVDLNGDGYRDGIIFEKIDGENWLHIHDTHLMRVKSFSLPAIGLDARIIKLRLAQVDKKRRVLLVYFYEGYVEYLDFHGSSRLYMITFHDGTLENAVMTRGPQYFSESEEIFKRYYLKRMKVSITDLNNDGVREIIVKKRFITQVYMLAANNHWMRLKPTL